ncbi:MAG TPA: hypothetical protein VND99_00105 [Candidatus Acidoferrales bacterium]|nr:hypothetical protein [Candidatus Acidoferrales bacterium]
MATRKTLVKPKPKTLKRAEQDLKNKHVGKTVKSPAGFVVRNAKGVRTIKKKRGHAK